jgi:hypothetical protein
MNRQGTPFDDICSLCDRLEGWCTPDKACHIAEIIIENGFERFVEVGVFGGQSLIAASYTFKYLGRGVAWGVDPWSNDAALEHMTEQEYVESWSRMDLEKIYVDFMRAVINHELTKQCRWIRERSEVAVRMFERESLDMIHIDGNHSEEMSSLDVRLWLPKIRPSGIVLMDDTDENVWPSTRKAVEMLKEDCDLIADRDGYSLFRKRGSVLR